MNEGRRNVIEVQRRYPIKEFSELVGVPQQTLRNWEEVFGDGFPVDRDPQNQRYYTDYHVRLVGWIQQWKEEENLTNSQIKPMLKTIRSMNPFEQGLMGEGDFSALAVQAEQVKSQTVAIGQVFTDQLEKQFSTYISQIQALFTMNLDDQRNMIREEIGRALETLDARDSRLISSLDDQNQSHREELQKTLINIADKAENQGEVTRQHLSELLAKDLEARGAAAEEQAKVIDKQLNDWAVVLREDIEKMSANKKRKWFWGK